jgi:3-phenylpropionate/trans-cinnamate dioxygenase ferredoxin reductase subunit
MMGNDTRDSVYVHPLEWYDEHSVDLRIDTRATAIDPAGHTVTLADGERLGYTKLLLTTGSSPRRLPLPGADLDGVLYLRTLADSDRIKEAIAGADRIAVIGAGWIGLETAAAARNAGVAVTVVEMAELPLLGPLGPEVARIFADLHTAHGVDLRLGARLSEITGSAGRATGVLLADGTRIDADAAVVGVGIKPNTDLAEAAGLAVENGIRVDDRLRTTDPDIYAAGDVAFAFHPLFGKHIRVEHWANALNQPQTAAKAMLGQDVSYDRVPYFFTDQYDLGMEYSGYVDPGGYDQVVFRGDPGSGEFIAFWLADRRVQAGMNANVWDVTDDIRGLVTSRAQVDTEKLADPGVALSDLV